MKLVSVLELTLSGILRPSCSEKKNHGSHLTLKAKISQDAISGVISGTDGVNDDKLVSLSHHKSTKQSIAFPRPDCTRPNLINLAVTTLSYSCEMINPGTAISLIISGAPIIDYHSCRFM